MKKCCHCKLEKPLEKFSKHPSHHDGLSSVCKDCKNDYNKKHYQTYKQHYLDKSKKQRLKIQEWFKDYKSKLKCARCPENHPATLDFHHTEDKEFNISNMSGRKHSINSILKEISKCEVLCANCHRKLHYEDIGN